MRLGCCFHFLSLCNNSSSLKQTPNLGMMRHVFYHCATTLTWKSTIFNVVIYQVSLRAFLDREWCEAYVLSPFPSFSWIQTPSLGMMRNMFYHWTATPVQKWTIINVAIYRTSFRAFLETENDCDVSNIFIQVKATAATGCKPSTLGWWGMHSTIVLPPLSKN